MGLKVPDLNPQAARQVVTLVERIRRLPLKKTPSISETWTGPGPCWPCPWTPSPKTFSTEPWACLLKYENDLDRARSELPELKRGGHVSRPAENRMEA